MNIHTSGATYSAIVGVAERIRQLSRENDTEYLALNRGVHQVCTIDLQSISGHLDYNSFEMQAYPPNSGFIALKEVVNEEYFGGKASLQNIFITPGGMSALDLILATLEVGQARGRIHFREYFWGTYKKIAQIQSKEVATYSDLPSLASDSALTADDVVIICDPNNPIGDKIPDDELLSIIAEFDRKGVVVIMDSPYRFLFDLEMKDDFYRQLLSLENVIISESFSKSIGLAGHRVAFMHCHNENFNTEFNIRLLYQANGVNTISQQLITNLFTREAGRDAIRAFRRTTTEHVQKNVAYLEEHELLYEPFYTRTPVGIFVIVNKSFEELLAHRIGSVTLQYFMLTKSDLNVARICLSVDHDKFRSYFNRMLAA